MSNSQEYLLEQILLLSIDNTRLQQQLHNSTTINPPPAPLNDPSVLNRIKEIEYSMSDQLKVKEDKILQLNAHIRQLHTNNKQIMQKYQNLSQNYQNLEKNYLKEVSQLKAMAQFYDSSSHRYQQSSEQSQYRVTLLEKQKQFLQQQVTKLREVTIKELQVDVELLNRENSTYMSTISTYREQVGQLKKQIGQLYQQLQQTNNLNKQTETQMNKYKHDFAIKLQKKQREVVEMANTIEDLKKGHEEELRETKRKLSKKFEIEMRKKQDSLERRKQKLREYDHQYDTYVQKMNVLTNDLHKAKTQISKNKEKAEKAIIEKQKIINENNTANKKLVSELERKNKQLQQQKSVTEDKLEKAKAENNKNRQEISMLEGEIKELRDKLYSTKNSSESRVQEAEKQREQAVKQWEELLQQMQKQKVIMGSLEKELDDYRKSGQRLVKSKVTQKIEYESTKVKDQNITQSRDAFFEEGSQQFEAKTILQESGPSQVVKKQIAVQYHSESIQEIHTAYHSRQLLNKKQNGQKGDEMESDQRLNKYFSSRDLSQRNSTCCEDCEANSKNRVKTQSNAYGSSQKKPLSLKRKDGNYRKYEYINNMCQSLREKTPPPPPQFFKDAVTFDIRKNQKQTIYEYPSSEYHHGQYASNHSFLSRNSTSLPKYPSARLFNDQGSSGRDDKREQIQKHLSFELKSSDRKISRSNSDKKFISNPPQSFDSNRLKTVDAEQPREEKSALMQKINKINSWREDDQSSKARLGFYKRNPQLNLQRNKENLNDIIHRKCLYMIQK